MVKKNYTAWQIDSSQFDNSWTDAQKLEFFARYAILAPSGHNTQPWQLTLIKDSLWVAINKDHYLSIDGSGLLSVEPYVSLGTFLETFSLAARGFGYELRIKTFPKKGFVATLTIKKKITAQPMLLEAISKRVSNRNAFERQAISPAVMKALTQTKLAGVKTSPITRRADIEFIASQTETGITTIMGNPLYRQELSRWVRTNQTRKYDGMPGFTHGFGHVKSLLSKAAIKHAPAGGPQAKKSGDLIRESGGLVIVRCSEDSKEAFVNAGRIYAQICVYAQANGLATSALGAAVLDGQTREEVKKRFHIKDRPVYLLRIGRATKKSAHAPRWPLEKVLSRQDA